MKKRLIIILLVLLSANLVFAQEYVSYSASSNIKSQNYKKTDSIWIISDSSSFLWNRYVEEAIRDEFKNKGVKVFINSDYLDINDLDDDFESMYEEIFKSKATFMLIVSVTNMYTYEYGGGIKQFDTVGSLINLNDGNTAFKVGIATEADTNDMLTYNASCKPSAQSMAKSLVAEYLRHVK